MKRLQLSDRQSSFIFYLVHEGKGRTEAARLAGFAKPRQSAFYLTQTPKIIAILSMVPHIRRFHQHHNPALTQFWIESGNVHDALQF